MSLEETLTKIKRGDIRRTSYEDMHGSSMLGSLIDLNDPEMAYISGQENIVLECGEMIAKAQQELEDMKPIAQCAKSILIEKLYKSLDEHKAQLASKPDESSLVKVCRAIVEYNEPHNFLCKTPKLRNDMYRKMKEALDTYPECPELKCEGRMIGGACDRCKQEQQEGNGTKKTARYMLLKIKNSGLMPRQVHHEEECACVTCKMYKEIDEVLYE